jgi:hypothetical protein
MIFINIILYLAAIALVLKFKKRCPVAGLCIPSCPRGSGFLLCRESGGQVNSVILFLIVLATYSAEKQRSVLSGLLFAVAALFKLFPLAAATVLRVRNRRIPAYCTLFFVVSCLIPGSMKWFTAIGNMYKADSMFTYLLFSKKHLAWLSLLYAVGVAGLSVLMA